MTPCRSSPSTRSQPGVAGLKCALLVWLVVGWAGTIVWGGAGDPATPIDSEWRGTNVVGVCVVRAISPPPRPRIRPAVFVLRRGEVMPIGVRLNDRLEPGDTLEVYPEGMVTLSLASGGELCLRGRDAPVVLTVSPDATLQRFTARLVAGVARLFAFGPHDTEIQSASATAAARHTEFEVRVLEAGSTKGRTEVEVFDGQVDFGNSAGRTNLDGATRALAVARVGVAPAPSHEDTDSVQWWIRFPVALDVGELPYGPGTRARRAAVLDAYASGRFREAATLLETLRSEGEPLAGGDDPADREADRILDAAVRLVLGDVRGARDRLRGVSPSSAPAAAVDGMTRLGMPDSLPPASVSEVSASFWLARSYAEQARHRLPEARRAAARAADLSPGFAAAWLRLAELELGHDDGPAAHRAWIHARDLAPEHPGVAALEGFLELSRRRHRPALEAFERAIHLDPSLADAWLGRGLARLSLKDRAAGLADLQTAVALEPERSALRTELGLAFADAGRWADADTQLGRARELDPRDPTPWLYGALLDRERNRPLAGMSNLVESVARNDNRLVFRTRLQLDQDLAVRSANRATLYRDLGMVPFAVAEASRAVAYDYGSHAAHLFLAGSYNEWRDPRGVSLRYETAAYTEYLLANLLAPAGAGVLSPTVTYGDSSPLVQHDGPHLNNSTTWTSQGDWTEDFAQYGTWQGTDYAVEGLYRRLNGERANHDLEQRVLRSTLRLPLSAADLLLFRVEVGDTDGGDLTPVVDPAQANPTFRFRERLEPLIVTGIRHTWSPEAVTLVLGAWGHSRLEQRDERVAPLYVAVDSEGRHLEWARPELDFEDIPPATLEQSFDARLFSVEGQHLQHTSDANVLVVGARLNGGSVQGDYRLSGSTAHYVSGRYGSPDGYPQPMPGSEPGTFEEPVRRGSVYLYDIWEPFAGLQLVGGLGYDAWEHPGNVVSPPFSQDDRDGDHWSPKAGIRFLSHDGFTARAGYAGGTTGYSFEQSLRLEPTEVAGTLQAFRSLMPEAVLGFVPDQEFQVAGITLEKHWSGQTHALVEIQRAWATADGSVGSYLTEGRTGEDLHVFARNLGHTLDYDEWRCVAAVNQAIGSRVAAGVTYRLTQGSLEDSLLRNVPGPTDLGPQDAILHQLQFGLRFHHESGFFAGLEARWWHEENGGAMADLEGDDLAQLDLLAGWHLFRRRATVSVGLLNVTDDDYRLHPLVYYQEPYRSRTLAVNFRFRL